MKIMFLDWINSIFLNIWKTKKRQIPRDTNGRDVTSTSCGRHFKAPSTVTIFLRTFDIQACSSYLYQPSLWHIWVREWDHQDFRPLKTWPSKVSPCFSLIKWTNPAGHDFCILKYYARDYRDTILVYGIRTRGIYSTGNCLTLMRERV